jgi:NNP family nitrate/nitrite transporter-like MFS transporter
MIPSIFSAEAKKYASEHGMDISEATASARRQAGAAIGVIGAIGASGGYLGVSVAQILVPIVITVGAIGSTINLSLAGWFWIPLILVAIWGARRFMNNLSNAKADFAASAAAFKEPHTWIMAVLYIGTFGSFIGFAGVFPKVIQTQFPEFSSFHVGAAAISLAFLGALCGSIARPFGGTLADRFGGATVTEAAFSVMAIGAMPVIYTLPLGNFWIFLGIFMVIFGATGIGNGSTYRMIPSIFAARAGVVDAHSNSGDVSVQRKTSAAIGIISAVGAYGGFIIPQLLGASLAQTGSYANAIWGFVVAYLVFITITAVFYLRRGAGTTGQRI